VSDLWEDLANNLGVSPQAIDEIAKNPEAREDLRAKGIARSLVDQVLSALPREEATPGRVVDLQKLYDFRQLYRRDPTQAEALDQGIMQERLVQPLTELASQIVAGQVPGPKLGTIRFNDIAPKLQARIESAFIEGITQHGIPEAKARTLWQALCEAPTWEGSITGRAETAREMKSLGVALETGRTPEKMFAPAQISTKGIASALADRAVTAVHEIWHHLNDLFAREIRSGEVGAQWQVGARSLLSAPRKYGGGGYTPEALAEEFLPRLMEPKPWWGGMTRTTNPEQFRETLHDIIDEIISNVAL